MFKLILKNGRYAAIFFPIIAFAQTTEIYGRIDTAINRGILDDNYWRAQSLNENSPKVLAYSDTKIGASAEVLNQKIFIERRKLATLSTNTNSLLAASNSDKALDDKNYGSYALNAKLKKFEFDAVGLVFQKKIQNDSTVVSVSPKLVRLNDFSLGEGQGDLQLGATSQTLNGSVDRKGLTSYGYTTEPTPTQMGLGGSVDFQILWKSQDLQINVDVQNFTSQIQAKGIFYNQRSYQVNAQSGSLVFSKTPSLTGLYGQTNETLRLPRIIKSSVTHQESMSRWSEYIGVISLEEGSIPWGGLGYSLGDSMLIAKTYAMSNLFLTYQKNSLFIPNLGFEVSIGTAFKGHNQMALTSVRYIF